MKTITLTQGQVALVDDADFKWLSRWKWYTWQSPTRPGLFYAVRQARCRNGTQRTVRMHSVISGLRITDHRDNNGLNNQRRNLRPTTRATNKQNGIKRRKMTSQYKGVCWIQSHACWHAQIKRTGRTQHLGFYQDEIKAAQAYDAAARRYFGEFARTNFPLSKFKTD